MSPAEQIENSSLYFEPANNTWFLFTNHIGFEGFEYTDAVWVYWTRDLNRWDAANKAVVLDGRNCTWSRKCIGLPSVVKVGNRLAVLYDAPGDDRESHLKRDVGLAWLPLPLKPPMASRVHCNRPCSHAWERGSGARTTRWRQGGSPTAGLSRKPCVSHRLHSDNVVPRSTPIRWLG